MTVQTKLQPRGKPFTAGHDPRRNVTGNPPSADLMELLRQKIPYERLVGALDKLVESGDPKTVHYCMDRHLGRPAQAVHITGDAEKPLHMLVGVEGRDLAPQLAQESLVEPVLEGEGDGAVVYLDEG